MLTPEQARRLQEDRVKRLMYRVLSSFCPEGYEYQESTAANGLPCAVACLWFEGRRFNLELTTCLDDDEEDGS